MGILKATDYEPRRYPPGCHGYENGCVCRKCKDRAEGKTEKVECSCERPVNNAGTCFNCGKPVKKRKRQKVAA